MPNYEIPNKMPWKNKGEMIALLREFEGKEPVHYKSQAILHEVETGKLNALNEQQGFEFYKDVLRAANEGPNPPVQYEAGEEG